MLELLVLLIVGAGGLFLIIALIIALFPLVIWLVVARACFALNFWVGVIFVGLSALAALKN